MANTTDPVRHSTLAQSLPLLTTATPTPLTEVQKHTLEWMATQPRAYMDHVREQLQYWTRRKEELRMVSAEAWTRLPPDKLVTVGHIDLFLLEEMLVKSGHKGVSYVQDMVEGFPVTGAIPSGGCGREVPGGQPGPGGP